MRCLWVSRVLPFPMTAGDRIYSANLAGALAASGADVTFTGFTLSDAYMSPKDIPGVKWRTVSGQPHSNLKGLLSLSPLVASKYSTASYHETISSLANDRWDAVVVDYYAMGWVLKHRSEFLRPRPIFVFVTHNHEESVTNLQWRDSSNSSAIRAFHFQNYLKTRRYERRLTRDCDLMTTITPGDAEMFKNTVRPPLVLLPGYDGARVAERKIENTLPRSILLFGSYQWSAKQASLREFLDCADAPLAAAGIKVRIVGDMPESFRDWLINRNYQSAEIIGRVDDPAPYLSDARLAIVAESIGGGFKMKLLEFIFNRLPVAALDVCTAGLPEAVRKHMLVRSDLNGLVSAIIEVMDDTERLNLMQNCAFTAANSNFDWKERGRTLHAAIEKASARMVES